MRAVILVGGFGTRLRPLTYETPKLMLPIVEVPMIERKIAQLVRYGIDDVVLSMGYKPDAFMDAFPDNRCAGATLHYVIESSPLGTAGAIAYAVRESGIDSTFIAVNGDTLTDLDIRRVVEFHQAHGALGTITLTPVSDPSRFGVVPTDDDGRVLAFIEKPAKEDAPTNLINAGTYVLEPSFVDRVPEGREVSIEREVFPQMVAEGVLFAGHFDRYWLDVGTPEAYLQGNLDVLDADYDSGSYIGEGATIADNAQVDRSVIGANVTVGEAALIIESVLMPGVTVEKGATIERSIVAADATVGAHAKLSDYTVVGMGLTVEPNAKLANAKVNPPEV